MPRRLPEPSKLYFSDPFYATGYGYETVKYNVSWKYDNSGKLVLLFHGLCSKCFDRLSLLFEHSICQKCDGSKIISRKTSN